MKAIKITKKDFLNLLVENKSRRILTQFTKGDVMLEDTIKIIDNIKPEDTCDINIRNVEVRNTVSLKFSDGSYLYYSNLTNSELYRYGNYLISIHNDSYHHIFIYELMEENK